jgi:glyoxylase-like metal-dependent hydrolase (beta-lactamase superfamily II)
MKRVMVLCGLLFVGGLSISLAGMQVTTGPTATSLSATKIEKIKDNLYMITGSNVNPIEAFAGGNTAVLVTETGVVVVDTKLPGWGQVLVDRIKTVTNKPITTIINTHTHGDHTGSNEFFGTNVETIVQENTKANMARMDEFKGAKARFLPKRTYKDRLTIGVGKDRIDLYHFGPAHTSGDTFVVFPALRVMHVGDVFAWKSLPYIDPANGGSVLEHPKTLARAIAAIKDVDTVITGHIPLATLNDLKVYADFSQDFADWAAAQVKAGKTADEAVAAYKVPAKFVGYTPSVNGTFGSPKDNTQIAFRELGKK